MPIARRLAVPVASCLAALALDTTSTKPALPQYSTPYPTYTRASPVAPACPPPIQTPCDINAAPLLASTHFGPFPAQSALLIHKSVAKLPHLRLHLPRSPTMIVRSDDADTTKNCQVSLMLRNLYPSPLKHPAQPEPNSSPSLWATLGITRTPCLDNENHAAGGT